MCFFPLPKKRNLKLKQILMKKLILVRHSHAEDDSYNDIIRDLTTKGKNVAKEVANNIQIKMSNSSTILSSPAFRAKQTAEIFCQQHNIDVKNIVESEFLYNDYNYNQFSEFITKSYNDVQELWIFGHNPSLTKVSYSLSNAKILSFPKCSVAYFEFISNKWDFKNISDIKLNIFYSPK